MRVSFFTAKDDIDYQVTSNLHQAWETTYDGIFKNKSYSIKAANIDTSKGTFKIDFITNGETTTLLNNITNSNNTQTVAYINLELSNGKIVPNLMFSMHYQ